jgi:hypothetical protein
MRVVCAVAVCVSTIPLLGGCSVTIGQPGGPPGTITVGTGVNPTADMAQKIQTWAASGPRQSLGSIFQDGPPITDSLVAGNSYLLGQQCAHLLSDVRAAQQMPPAPDQILQNYWAGALDAYSAGATECEAIADGNETLVDQYSADVTAGNDELRQFTARLVAFNNGQAVPFPGQ